MVGVQDRFWSLTPREFGYAVNAHQERQQQQRQLVAWHAANVINVWLKSHQRVTPQRLLGESGPRKFSNKAELIRRMRERQREVEARG
jgi:hypothetical protein